MLTMPKNEEEGLLVSMMFEKVTELFPDWGMGDRTDLAMSLFSVVKRWAHKNEMTTQYEPPPQTGPVVVR